MVSRPKGNGVPAADRACCASGPVLRMIQTKNSPQWMNRNGRLPREVRDPVGGLHHGGAVVLGLLVDVARGGVPQQLRRLAQPPAGRRQQLHRRGRARAQELLQIAAIDDDRLQILGDVRRRRARAAVEQRDLAEEVALAGGLEHDALAGVVLEEDLDLAGAHDVERIARIAVVEQRRAGRLAHGVDARGERRPLLLVEQREERDLGQDFGIGAHAKRDYRTERSWTENVSRALVGARARSTAAPRCRTSLGVAGWERETVRRAGGAQRAAACTLTRSVVPGA